MYTFSVAKSLKCFTIYTAHWTSLYAGTIVLYWGMEDKEEEGEKMDEIKIESERKTSLCNMLTDKGRIACLFQLSFRSRLLYLASSLVYIPRNFLLYLAPFCSYSLAIFFSRLFLPALVCYIHAAQSSFKPYGRMHTHTLQ